MSEQDFYDFEIHEVEFNRIIDKWSGLGFLANSVNKRNDALAFELLATWLLKTYKHYDTELQTILFPVIHRIVRRQEEDIPIYIIKNLVLELSDTFPIKKYLGLKPNDGGKDTQAIFLYDYCENYPPFMF